MWRHIQPTSENSSPITIFVNQNFFPTNQSSFTVSIINSLEAHIQILISSNLGFHGMCYNNYMLAQPHSGHTILLDWMQKKYSSPVLPQFPLEVCKKQKLCKRNGLDCNNK